MPKCLAEHEYYCFLDGFSGYFEISISPEDQEKTTFTCPYRTFAYKRMPFRLCNAPATFQRCMTAIFYELIEYSMEVFMDDFSVFECIQEFDKLKRKLTQAPIMTKPDWSLPFKVMCDVSDYAVEAE
ncbi:reverse transcriptase domain-containing protein [Tanacetum coccineum]